MSDEARIDLSRRLIRVFHAGKLLNVLSHYELCALLSAKTCLKHRAVLSVPKSAGLRVGKAASLKVGHTATQRVQIDIARGTVSRYRNAMLSDDLLTFFRMTFSTHRFGSKLFARYIGGSHQTLGGQLDTHVRIANL
jgi:hypothetical protein